MASVSAAIVTVAESAGAGAQLDAKAGRLADDHQAYWKCILVGASLRPGYQEGIKPISSSDGESTMDVNSRTAEIRCFPVSLVDVARASVECRQNAMISPEIRAVREP